jgi:hypothetical protein
MRGEEEEEEESFISHIQAQGGSSMHLLQPKHLQPGNMSITIKILNNIIYNYTPPPPKKKKNLQKFGEGYLYEKSESEFIDVYAQ